MDTLKILNGAKDIVQIFSHCVDLDHNDMTMSVFNSAGYQYSYGKTYCNTGPNYWHPGFAWACTRKAYEKMGGIYEYAILGSGDNITMLSLIQNGVKALIGTSHTEYVQSVIGYEQKVKTLRFGYVPGLIRHYFHGSKVNRKYTDRWKILSRYEYRPDRYVRPDEEGVLIPTESCPTQLLEDIYHYFSERNEDESFIFNIKK
jgi:hypothetical protein